MAHCRQLFFDILPVLALAKSVFISSNKQKMHDTRLQGQLSIFPALGVAEEMLILW